MANWTTLRGLLITYSPSREPQIRNTTKWCPEAHFENGGFWNFQNRDKPRESCNWTAFALRLGLAMRPLAIGTVDVDQCFSTILCSTKMYHYCIVRSVFHSHTHSVPLGDVKRLSLASDEVFLHFHFRCHLSWYFLCTSCSRHSRAPEEKAWERFHSVVVYAVARWHVHFHALGMNLNKDSLAWASLPETQSLSPAQNRLRICDVLRWI